MTFLNPYILFGLVAAGIPILLHIFNLRKLKTVEFSTITFLKELQKTRIRRLKLKQMLLLFLRILLIVLIVLAFARPTLKGSLTGGLAEQAKTTALILLDDSQSMTAIDEQGELLHQAKRFAINIIDMLKEGDEVILIKLSDIEGENLPEGIRNFNAIRKSINEIKPSFAHRKIEDGLRYCAKSLNASTNFNKELFIISDFQSGSSELINKTPKSIEQLFSASTQVFLIPLGKREQQNISVESVSIQNAIFTVNRPFNVIAKITNHGTKNVQNHVVSIFQDGIRTAQKGIDIHAGQTVEVNFSLTSKKTGFIEGMIELENDDLEFDNRRYFSLKIPEILRVILVGTKADLSYLRIALTSRITDTNTVIQLTETNWERFSTSHLTNADVVILCNISKLMNHQIFALKNFIQLGKGILVFPGNNTTVTEFNDSFASPLGSSKIVQTGNRVNQSDKSFIEFDKVDLRHPLFAGMFEEGNLNRAKPVLSEKRARVLETPRINSAIGLLPTPNSKSIITLSNGYPFLLEDKIGNGRILIISVSPNTEWSDLPLKGLFVPLMHRSIAYLAQEPSIVNTFTILEEKKGRIRIASVSKIRVTKPDGTEILLNTQQFASERITRFNQTDIPGVYKLIVNNQIFEKFSVNIDANESKIDKLDKDKQIEILSQFGVMEKTIHYITQPQDIQRVVTESRVGAELWKHFLIASLCVALIEMLVARDSKKSLINQKI